LCDVSDKGGNHILIYNKYGKTYIGWEVDYRRGAKIRPHWLTNIVDSPILKGISYETSKKKEFNIFPKHLKF